METTFFKKQYTVIMFSLLGFSHALFCSTPGLNTQQKNTNQSTYSLIDAVNNDDAAFIRNFLKITPSPIEENFLIEEKYSELVNLLTCLQKGTKTKCDVYLAFLTFFYGNYSKNSLNILVNIATTDSGQTLLHEVITRNLPEVLPILLNFGANPFVYNDNNETALALAIKNNSSNLFTPFIEKYSVLITKPIDLEGNTFLHLAIKQGKNSVVTTILSKDNAYLAIDLTNKKDETPLHIAYQQKDLFTMADLIATGASLYNKTRWASYRKKLNDVIDLNKDKVLAPNALYEDSKEPHETCIKFATQEKLLKEENIGYQSTPENNPEQPTRIIDLETLKQLLHKYDSLKPAFHQMNKLPYNPLEPLTKSKQLLGSILHQACYWGDLELVQLIINNGGDPSCLDSLGNTPLHIAVQERHYRLITYLLSKNVTFLYNKNKQTPLHLACRQNNKKLVELLVKNIPQNLRSTIINKEETSTYPSPFSIACQEGKLPILYFLMQEGALPNGQDVPQKTFDLLTIKTNHNYKENKTHLITATGPLPPVFHALKEGNLHIVKALIKNGANPDAKDLRGRTVANYLALKSVYQSTKSQDTSPKDLAQLLYPKGNPSCYSI